MKLRQRVLAELSFLPWFLAAIVPLLLIPFRRRKSLKILIFPQSKIGDLIAQTPLFREIKRFRPQARITVVLTNPILEDLLRCDPHIDTIILWDAKAARRKKCKLILTLIKENYSWSFNLAYQSWIDFITVYALVPHRAVFVPAYSEFILRFFYALSGTRRIRYPKGGFSTSAYLGIVRSMGITSDATERFLYPCPEHETFACDFIQKSDLRRGGILIGMAVSCGTKLKQMPIEKIAELTDLLIDTYKATVVFIGGAEDKGIVDAVHAKTKHKGIDCTGAFTLGQLAAFCKQLDCFISVDSGPLHIAHAVGTPVIDIAGPIDLSMHLTISAKAKAVYSQAPCAPCSSEGETPGPCKIGKRICLEEMDVRGVTQALEELLPIIRSAR